MKTSGYSDIQIISILKQNENSSRIVDLCWEHGMSQATFYKWCSKYGGMDTSLMKERVIQAKEQSPASICLVCDVFRQREGLPLSAKAFIRKRGVCGLIVTLNYNTQALGLWFVL